MDKILNNMLSSARLQGGVFHQAKEEPEMASHALVAVLLSCVAAGIGSTGRIGIAGIVLGTFGALASWAVWVGFVYFACMAIVPSGKTQPLSLVDFLRISGFASVAGMIRILGIIPPLYPLVITIGYLWMAIAMAVALKEAAGYRTFAEAILITSGSWVAMYVLVSVFLSSRVF